MYKSVLVTGASSGIGEAAAVDLARKGFRVFAGARRIERLKALEGLGGGRIVPLRLDVADQGSIDAAMGVVADAGATLFGLVNNAGISVTGPIEELATVEWRRQFETNVIGAASMIRAVLPQMRAAKEGRIVNIGSVAGRIASPFMGAYAASKHALEGLNDALRREVRAFGVKVSLVRPGFINTPFGAQEQEGFARVAEAGGPYAKMAAAFKAWHAKGHPTGASPHEVAAAILHALTAAKPNALYTAPLRYVGTIALRDALPSSITDRVFARVTGLGEFQQEKP